MGEEVGWAMIGSSGSRPQSIAPSGGTPCTWACGRPQWWITRLARPSSAHYAGNLTIPPTSVPLPTSSLRHARQSLEHSARGLRASQLGFSGHGCHAGDILSPWQAYVCHGTRGRAASPKGADSATYVTCHQQHRAWACIITPAGSEYNCGAFTLGHGQ